MASHLSLIFRFTDKAGMNNSNQTQIVGLTTNDISIINGSKRIFIPTIGTWGDVLPFLILAKRLKERGHHVLMGVHKRFQHSIEQNGNSKRFRFVFRGVLEELQTLSGSTFIS